MSTNFFAVHEHTLPCFPVRSYARATIHGTDDRLQLAIKQYVPHDNTDPQAEHVTILGAHANGFPKELYEPLWDELYHRLKAVNLRIRGIWISDVAWQGYSSVLNEDKLGNDPNWLDHSLDLLMLINHFSAQMPRPIIGIGHSMGGCMLTNLALIQPRLLSGLILIDPVIAATQGRSNWSPARASSGRRDLWPSRDAAASAFAKSKFYQTWDKRVLDLWTEHGLRDLPTALYPSAEGEDKQVTLRTSKHQEVHSFARPTYRAASDRDGPNRPPTRSTHPDLPIAVAPSRALPFYRPEPASVFARLPNLHPGTLYVFGAHSDLSTTVDRAEKLALTGTGVGGSGGAREGRVKEVVLDAGHLVPMERVGETASAAAEWIASELNRFEDEKRDVRQELENVPLDQRARMSPRFVELISGRKGSQAGKPKI